MSLALRRALYGLGSGVALVGIAFVAWRLSTTWGSVDLLRIEPAAWAVIAALTILYGVANVLLATAWWLLLAQFGVQTPLLWSVKVYGVAQIAKYIPGNIFHLAGRQAIGMAAGASSKALAKSTLWELGSMALAGTPYGWLILPLLAPGLPPAASILLLLATVWLGAYLLRRFIGARLAVSFGLQALFLAASGSLFVALLEVILRGSGLPPQTWLSICGAYVVAWLAGLVTPGAPAGVGIRELALFLLLNGLVPDADLLMAILLGRLVTMAGDLVFFLVSYLIPASFCVLNARDA